MKQLSKKFPKSGAEVDEAHLQEDGTYSLPVYSSKKQYKEDIEGKFDLIVEADEINESDTEVNSKK
jgi:hypothetical protein